MSDLPNGHKLPFYFVGQLLRVKPKAVANTSLDGRYGTVVSIAENTKGSKVIILSIDDKEIMFHPAELETLVETPSPISSSNPSLKGEL
jgi:hypothetical protein